MFLLKFHAVPLMLDCFHARAQTETAFEEPERCFQRRDPVEIDGEKSCTYAQQLCVLLSLLFCPKLLVFFFTAEALRVHLFICLVSLLAKTQKKFAATMCIWGVGPIQPILDVDPVHPARSELATCAATGWWS